MLHTIALAVALMFAGVVTAVLAMFAGMLVGVVETSAA
jgi:hypothetical protein